MNVTKLTVECYSGWKANERPVRFWCGQRQDQIEAVLDQWYAPESISYKVRADDGNSYVLRQQTSTILVPMASSVAHNGDYDCSLSRRHVGLEMRDLLPSSGNGFAFNDGDRQRWTKHRGL